MNDVFPRWLINLIIVIGVVLAVFSALLFANLDFSQRRSNLPLKEIPVLDIQATIAAEDLSIIYLQNEITPSPTATKTNQSTTLTPSKVDEPLINPIIKPTCGSAPASWSPYTVKPEDSLYELAVRFGISESTIIQANCLINDQLLEDQTILLPLRPVNQNYDSHCNPPPDWEDYTVATGDDLFNLAANRGASMLQIMRANCLESTQLLVGRIIYLPPEVISPNIGLPKTPSP